MRGVCCNPAKWGGGRGGKAIHATQENTCPFGALGERPRSTASQDLPGLVDATFKLARTLPKRAENAKWIKIKLTFEVIARSFCPEDRIFAVSSDLQFGDHHQPLTQSLGKLFSTAMLLDSHASVLSRTGSKSLIGTRVGRLARSSTPKPRRVNGAIRSILWMDKPKSGNGNISAKDSGAISEDIEQQLHYRLAAKDVETDTLYRSVAWSVHNRLLESFEKTHAYWK